MYFCNGINKITQGFSILGGGVPTVELVYGRRSPAAIKVE